jgi:hypothetical protein
MKRAALAINAAKLLRRLVTYSLVVLLDAQTERHRFAPAITSCSHGIRNQWKVPIGPAITHCESSFAIAMLSKG